jgi:hypothetical protein
MLKRYIGHQSPVEVVIGGENFGTVETGDQIVVPDDLADSISWSEDNWEDGAAKASTTDNKSNEKSDE